MKPALKEQNPFIPPYIGHKNGKTPKYGGFLVGGTGLEPATTSV
jgi:hypothetical protein